MGKRTGSLAAHVLSTPFNNFVNFGPLTLEITVIIWRPFMRQMHEIGETRSILGTRIRQWTAGTIEMNVFAPNSHGRHDMI